MRCKAISLVLCLLVSPSMAQDSLDIAWGICLRQTDASFIPDCSRVRQIRERMRRSPTLPAQDFGAGNKAYIEQALLGWSGM